MLQHAFHARGRPSPAAIGRREDGGAVAADHGLPPVVARMWGREPASRHGPRPSLDLATITAAAIEIADREGLAGVRMSSVASRLGVATMSLYRYVGSKDDLLTAMVDASAPEPPVLEGCTWRAYLAAWTRANHDVLLSRPWLLEVTRTSPPSGPRSMRWLDRALAALADAGLEPGESINVATTLTGYALSQATLAHSLNLGRAAAAEHDVTGAASYARMLASLLDPEEYPALSAAVAADAFGSAEEWIDDADFRFGLDLLLDGVETLVARRAAGRTAGTDDAVSR